MPAAVRIVPVRRESPVRRLLRLLGSFEIGATELSLTELSRRSRLPISTVHRMVNELLDVGALERAPGTGQQRYRVGLRMWEIAALAPRALGLRETAFPFLEDLYLATRENVLLAVRDGIEVVFVERLSAPDTVPVLTKLGRRRSLHASSAGLVLLAFAPPDVQGRVLAAPLRRYTAHTLADPEELRSELDRIRRTGIAVSDGHMTLTALSVAAPVRDATDEVVASLSVVVPAEGADQHRLTPAVLAAARGVSRALGAPSAQQRAAVWGGVR